MRRIARWSRSVSTLVVLNAVLVSLAVGIGCVIGAATEDRQSTELKADTQGPPVRTRWQHASHIFRGNFRVVVGMLAGVCTLSGLTLFTLLWNGYSLGLGLVALALTTAGAIPLVLQYVLLEFFAFVLVASVAEHLTVAVLRCLAANEPVRPAAALLTLAVAILLLGVAAVIEADVTLLLRQPL